MAGHILSRMMITIPVMTSPVDKPIMGAMISHLCRSRVYVAARSSETRGKYLRKSGCSLSLIPNFFTGLVVVFSVMTLLFRCFSGGTRTRVAPVLQDHFKRLDQSRTLRIQLPHVDLRKPVEHFLAASRSSQTNAAAILKICHPVKQPFPFAPIHQFDDGVVLQTKGFGGIRNRG